MFNENDPQWKQNKDLTHVHFIQVWDQTFENQVEEYNSWFYPTFLIHQMMMSVWDSYGREELTKSLAFRRLLSYRRTLQWCIFSAYSGAYESIARNLRFILEDLAQAVHMDDLHKDSELTKKVLFLQKFRLRGRNLIDRLAIESYLIGEMKDLYGKLCDYVHPSFELVKRGLVRNQMFFEYDEFQFKSLLQYYVKTCDIIFSMILIQFPHSIKRLPYVFDGPEKIGPGFIEEGYEFAAKTYHLIINRK
jgi:hypothetical protein